MSNFKTPPQPIPCGRHKCMGPNTSDNSIDLAMNDLCYDTLKMVFV